MEALRDLWTGAGLEAVETREITVHRTFADFDDFWMTKVKVPRLAPQSPRWHPETSRRSRAGCARAYRRHRRTDHARSLEYCCLMRDFTEDDATMQQRFAMRAPRWKWATQPAPKFFEAQSSLSWRPSSQIRPDGLMAGTGGSLRLFVMIPLSYSSPRWVLLNHDQESSGVCFRTVINRSSIRLRVTC